MAGFDFGNIEISIDDPKSISDAITRINLIQAGLKRAIKAMHEYLLEEGVTIARYEIVRLCNTDMMSGDLWMSVKSSPQFEFDETTGKGKAYITAGEGLKKGKDGMSYAVYVEFGTGVYSEERAKKEAEAKRSTTAWGGTLKLPNAKKPQEETLGSVKPMHFQGKDGKWYTTDGQRPKPFMRNTMYELWQRAKKKWAELLNQYLPREMG